MSTHDNAISITVGSDLAGVDRKDFGTVLHVTDDVGAGFPLLRVYDGPASIKADSDVNQPTIDFLVNYGFAQNPRVRKIAVGKVSYIATLSDELDALVAEEASTGIPWYGFDLSSLTEADILDAAAWAESSKKLYIAQSSDTDVKDGTAGNVAEDLNGFSYDRTGLIYHLPDTERAALAWLSKKLAKNPDGPGNGKTTWRHATLGGVAVDTLTDTERDTINGNEANTYLKLGGAPTTAEGHLATGNPIDTRISRDWTEARLFERFAALFVAYSNRNEDIPYDQDGLNILFAELREFLQLGEDLRHFRRGSSTFVRPRIADIPTADVLARLLRILAGSVLAGTVERLALDIAVQLAA